MLLCGSQNNLFSTLVLTVLTEMTFSSYAVKCASLSDQRKPVWCLPSEPTAGRDPQSCRSESLDLYISASAKREADWEVKWSLLSMVCTQHFFVQLCCYPWHSLLSQGGVALLELWGCSPSTQRLSLPDITPSTSHHQCVPWISHTEGDFLPGPPKSSGKYLIWVSAKSWPEHISHLMDLGCSLNLLSDTG